MTCAAPVALTPQILWFADPSVVAGSGGGTRCLLHYKDGGVAQSVLPQLEPRLREAMQSYNVAGKELPFEPRHMAELDHRIRMNTPGVPVLDDVLRQYVKLEVGLAGRSMYTDLWKKRASSILRRFSISVTDLVQRYTMQAR